MIKISDKHNCCGCSACVQICPKQCIRFEEDECGFRYPVVDSKVCVDCGLCEKVCPCLHQEGANKPLKVFAAINLDEKVRMESSSGGLFTIMAESVLDVGGVVFGARFDEKWEVIHGYIEKKEDIKFLRGSKYVQSRIGNVFQQVKEFLKSGREVLFSGTACQIAGLKHFLNKDYPNLLLIDVLCHGVPSPLVWRDYIGTLINANIVGNGLTNTHLNNAPYINDIFFRSKLSGWKKFSFVVSGSYIGKEFSDQNRSTDIDGRHILYQETLDKNLYMQFFLKNLCLRPSCYNCPAKSGKCGSDLTLADFWGIGRQYKEWDDDKGTSLVLCNSEKGLDVVKSLNIKYEEMSYDLALAGNPSLENSVEENNYVARFWRVYHENGIVACRKVLDSIKPSAIRLFSRKIKKYLRSKLF